MLQKILILAIVTTLVLSEECSYEDLTHCYNLENFFVDGQIHWPTDDGSVQELCGKLLEGGSCVHGFSDRCNKNPESKEKVDNNFAAIKMYHESICGSAEGRAGFLDRVQCYSNPNVEGPMRVVHRKYVAMVEKIARFEVEHRKQTFCCALLFVKDSAKGPVTANCKKETVDYLKSLLTIVSTTFKSECGDITDFTACAAALPDGLGTELKAIADGGDFPVTQNKLALPTIFELWQESSEVE